jgi:hypothetical protein
MAQNLIRVPQGCPTVEKAMALAVIFSERKEYTETDPLKIRLEMGVHEIVGNNKTLNVTCSHVTFVGEAKDHTTIRGGFKVHNQHGVTFDELTVSNPCGNGLRLWGSETHVEVLKCTVKECGNYGVYAHGGVTVTATQCQFIKNSGSGMVCSDANTKVGLTDSTVHHNGSDGLWADLDAVVDLRGTKMEFHSNKEDGIYATENAKVNIHLPSEHNTSHDNNDGDRVQERGGSIANINADGTFTHVVEEEDDDADDDSL